MTLTKRHKKIFLNKTTFKYESYLNMKYLKYETQLNTNDTTQNDMKYLNTEN